MAEASKRQRLTIGLLLVVIGLAIAVLIALQPQQLRVPAWVAYAAVSTFPLAGVALVAGVLGAHRLVAWLGVLMAAGLLVPSLWVAVGPGPQKCSVSFGAMGGAASDWVCRAGFGVGSMLAFAILVLLMRHAVSPRRAGTSDPSNPGE